MKIQNLTEILAEGILPICAVTMVGSYLFSLGASVYDGYMTAKTGEVSCARTLVSTSAAIGFGDLSERLQDHTIMGSFHSDIPFLGRTFGVAAPAALLYTGGYLAGKLDGVN